MITKPTFSHFFILNFGEFLDKIMIFVKLDRCKNSRAGVLIQIGTQISVRRKARSLPAYLFMTTERTLVSHVCCLTLIIKAFAAQPNSICKTLPPFEVMKYCSPFDGDVKHTSFHSHHKIDPIFVYHQVKAA